MEDKWVITADHHASGAVEVFEEGGIPVLVAHVGRYPRAEHPDGRSTATEPHILITVLGRICGSSRDYSGVTIEAVGSWHGSRRRAIAVFSDTGYDEARYQSDPAGWITIGKNKLPDALSALRGIDAAYEAASAVVAPTLRYEEPLSREGYEAACAACGVAALTDAECSGYGVRYGDFSFPEYPAETVAQIRLASLRLRQIDADAAAADRPVAPPAVPVQQGQLWEPCEVCGAEPVYMPLHVCANCWPK